MPEEPPAPSAVEGPAPSAVEGPPRPHGFRALVRSRIGAVPVESPREADLGDELAQHVADDYAGVIASGTADADAIRDIVTGMPRNSPSWLARHG